ncbi:MULTISPECIES: tRNA (guanosine(46)-N7)-methyltransferase TrmB [unclassified Gemella]|uniref:tRNA (guanosine(46)-N7)-methyltransferase TrmB n=1 Tax=unclassified Gemella TaxID=2624949 RepID=UPI0010738631|nr:MULTISPECIES: tRNA (guanosine(46)-N7)-methyltransferase TrmB [unclassified Gemella]MBF0710141.1 tRNA (guanosine(46)-N7)-methyltransferase TrmB [Gemella sp. GL1.1]MBF0746220.1 tRNA (guanosine(46)-N7)-methyltransferase TrmB [Gemella sp. 19428wG2_WT2a]NYS27485.1 tRNA (guanosine(46)-N7)-methyltransferase TrmB [Gemella sp. GL1]TFU60503.1 tRNA (guanosine(46)-N7)-methyltransferase TrmB [Gemella sp. WT2a]
MRVRFRSDAKDRLEKNSFVFIDPVENKGNWNNIFKNSNLIHLEIGTGKGQFIFNLAKKNPNINFIGLETQPTILSYLLDKIEGENVSNLRLILADANNVVNYFAEGEISKLYLNFSDPWPKTRHEKRRLTFKKFLKQYEYILNGAKLIAQKTDNMELFEYSLWSYSNYGFKINNISLDLTNSKYEKENLHTEYEDKFIKKGNNIYYVEVYKN